LAAGPPPLPPVDGAPPWVLAPPVDGAPPWVLAPLVGACWALTFGKVSKNINPVVMVAAMSDRATNEIIAF